MDQPPRRPQSSSCHLRTRGPMRRGLVGSAGAADQEGNGVGGGAVSLLLDHEPPHVGGEALAVGDVDRHPTHPLRVPRDRRAAREHRDRRAGHGDPDLRRLGRKADSHETAVVHDDRPPRRSDRRAAVGAPAPRRNRESDVPWSPERCRRFDYSEQERDECNHLSKLTPRRDVAAIEQIRVGLANSYVLSSPSEGESAL